MGRQRGPAVHGAAPLPLAPAPIQGAAAGAVQLAAQPPPVLWLQLHGHHIKPSQLCSLDVHQHLFQVRGQPAFRALAVVLLRSGQAGGGGGGGEVGGVQRARRSCWLAWQARVTSNQTYTTEQICQHIHNATRITTRLDDLQVQVASKEGDLKQAGAPAHAQAGADVRPHLRAGWKWEA